LRPGLNTPSASSADSLLDSRLTNPRYIETIPAPRFTASWCPVEFQDGTQPRKPGNLETSQPPQHAAALTPTVATLCGSRDVYGTVCKIGEAGLVVDFARSHRCAGCRRRVLAGPQPPRACVPLAPIPCSSPILRIKTGDPRFDDALLTAFYGKYRPVPLYERISAEPSAIGAETDGKIRHGASNRFHWRERSALERMFADLIASTNHAHRTGIRADHGIDRSRNRSHGSFLQRTSYGEDHILDTLDSIAGRLRADLGQSLHEIQNADRPLPKSPHLR